MQGNIHGVQQMSSQCGYNSAYPNVHQYTNCNMVGNPNDVQMMPPTQFDTSVYGYPDESYQSNAPLSQAVYIQEVPLYPQVCPICGVGMMDFRFTCCGIFLCIILFPIGIIFCILLREYRCNHCGSVLVDQ